MSSGVSRPSPAELAFFRRDSLATNFGLVGQDTLPRKGKSESPPASFNSHLAWGLLRRPAAETRSGSHPRASWLLRLVDCNGGRTFIGNRFQPYTARFGPAATRRLYRYEAEVLSLLHNRLRLQPPLYLRSFPCDRSKESHSFAAGSRHAGVRKAMPTS